MFTFNLDPRDLSRRRAALAAALDVDPENVSHVFSCSFDVSRVGSVDHYLVKPVDDCREALKDDFLPLRPDYIQDGFCIFED